MKNKKNPKYLDGKQQFMKNIYQRSPIYTNFYQRYLCIDSRPIRFQIQTLPPFHDRDQSQDNNWQEQSITNSNECYIYLLDQLGSINKSVYEQYQIIIGYPVNLQHPTVHTIRLFRKVSLLYRNCYGSNNLGLLIRYIFGECSEQVQKFYMDYIYQKQSEQQETVISKYKQNTQTQIKEYLYRTCKFLPSQEKAREQFCNRFSQLLDKRLSNLNIKTSDSRFQDIVQMTRALNCMFGFELHGQKYEGMPSYNKNSIISLSQSIGKQKNVNTSQQQKQMNKLLLKTCIIEFKKAPKYEINTQLFRSFYREQISLSKQNTTFQQEVEKQTGVFNLETLVNLFQKRDSIFKISYPLSKVKFAIYVTSQLIQYQMLTGSQYPSLHPLNIFYNSMTDNFVLSPTPVIIKALGYQNRTYSSSNFMQNFYKQQHMERDFSIENQIKENSTRLILLMHYLEQKKWEIGRFKKSHLNEPDQWLKTLFKKIEQNELKKVLEMEQNKQRQFEQQQNQLQKQLQNRIQTEQDNSRTQVNIRLAKQKRQQNKNYICNGLMLKQVIQENSFTKTLLLKCVPSKKLPTLIDIDQKMHLNCHISDVSPYRTEYVLHMRYRMMSFLNKIITEAHDRIDSVSKKQNNQELRVLKATLKISQRIIFLLEMASSFELLTILRKQDQSIEKEVIEKIQKFLQVTKEKEYMKKNFQQTGLNKPQCELFLEFQILLVNRLRYISEVCKKKLNDSQMNMNYSKILWKLVTLSLKNELFRDLIINVYKKYYQLYNEKNLQFFPIIIEIFFLTLIKLNHENIFWFEHFVFKEVKDLLYKKKLNKGYFDKILNQINKKSPSTWDSLWKGMVWDEEKQYLNVYFD